MATAPGCGPPASSPSEHSASADQESDRRTPSVVVFDGTTRAALYRRWLSEQIRVESAGSIAEGRDAVDESTAVALVRHELPEPKRKLVAEILDRQADRVRVVLTTSDHQPVSDPVVDEDACLCEPIDRSSLRAAVSRQIAAVTFGRLLVEYYECTTALASRKVQLPPDEQEADERIRRLESRRTDLAAGIETLQKRLPSDELRAVLHEISPPEYERESRERKPESGSKYRPEGCGECDRQWNVNPDGSPAGYRRLGAFVWECTDCGAVCDRSDPANQRIARRR